MHDCGETSPRRASSRRTIEQRLYEQTWDCDDYDLLTRLQRVRVPTLIIHGDADLIPVEVARHIAEAIPDTRLEVLDDCGHFAYLDQPERTEDAITGFLTTATTPAVDKHVGESVTRPTFDDPVTAIAPSTVAAVATICRSERLLPRRRP